ncbi:DEP domain-containing protein [Crocosphaera watsonii]|uniref:Probable RND efflux membrane fusion protein n=1 Tax=Crocosphaera watsonii WH 0401 TaxID=555881 RepID=T2J9Y5_CROWT|nr:DEP domain-containing protein [Crocosphaera watsonii]CCQ62015.1 Probable RND efflux membrane fusion protein [Crocosphaera watsonii WH 0401]
MKILDHKQVKYCNLVKPQQDDNLYLPGLIFKNKLFIKDKSFNLEQQKEAQDYGKQQFLNSKGQKEYLLLEDVTGFIIWQESEEVKLLKLEPKNNGLTNSDLEKIVTKVRGEKGVEIKDRRYLLELYPKCFVGSDLVDWMVDNLSIPLEKAVKIGQQLVDNKIIHHVHDQHEFENRYLFYRFYIDE